MITAHSHPTPRLPAIRPVTMSGTHGAVDAGTLEYFTAEPIHTVPLRALSALDEMYAYFGSDEA